MIGSKIVELAEELLEEHDLEDYETEFVKKLLHDFSEAGGVDLKRCQELIDLARSKGLS